jgi:hypothetical protein
MRRALTVVEAIEGHVPWRAAGRDDGGNEG